VKISIYYLGEFLMIKIKWLAHASFIIEGDGLRIITDPYDPKDVNVPPVIESADIVIRSSADDVAHAHIDTIPPGFDLVTATEIVETGITVRGLEVTSIWSQESLIHKDVARDNAMYRFKIGGINITHLGDVGNALTNKQIAALSGTDVLLALAGGPPTIELDDLYQVIQAIKPRVVIPMHYRIPGPKFFMLPVTELTSYFPKDSVTWFERSEVILSPETLPMDTCIYVLQPSRVGE
jgi:L-ascorbate metabolism protein UlaG (beta-lactamase superfamily)